VIERLSCAPVHRPIASAGRGAGVGAGVTTGAGGFVGTGATVGFDVGVGVAVGAAVGMGVGVGVGVAVAVAAPVGVAAATVTVGDVPAVAADEPQPATTSATQVARPIDRPRQRHAPRAL
jgi:hypothetical protein